MALFIWRLCHTFAVEQPEAAEARPRLAERRTAAWYKQRSHDGTRAIIEPSSSSSAAAAAAASGHLVVFTSSSTGIHRTSKRPFTNGKILHLGI